MKRNINIISFGFLIQPNFPFPPIASQAFMFAKLDGTPLQYSCLENPMDGGAWWAAVHGVTKSRTRLSDFTFTVQFHALEKEMATHSSVLACRVPGTGEPGGLPSMGSHSQTRLKRLSSSSTPPRQASGTTGSTWKPLLVPVQGCQTTGRCCSRKSRPL